MTSGSSTNKPKGRATLQHIANASGVSRATVSLVMRGSSAIPQRTKELVLHQANELGYVYNRSAASLRSQSTGTIGLLVHDITNPYFSQMVSAMQPALSDENYVAFLCDSGDSPERQSDFLNTMREYNVDGILMSPAAGTDGVQLREKLRLWRMPCVFYSRHLDATDFDYIGGSNFAEMKGLTAALIRAGHRRIAFVGANETMSSGRERLAGHKAALHEAGIEPDANLIWACASTRSEGSRVGHKLLAVPDKPTAIACFNDVLAFGVMLAVRNAGLEVGRDVAVTGYDDVDEAALWLPALTTNHVPTDEIGRLAVTMLLERIRNFDAPPRRHLVSGKLMVRGSARLTL